MGTPKRPIPAKFIVGMISAETELFSELEKLLSERFGPVDLKSGIFPFIHTDYYEKEMGKDLKRKFISFERLIDPVQLWKIKLFANSLEAEFSRGILRKINLDPGYVTAGKLVLATTKDRQHRIYVREGIYEEVTLRFHKGDFEPWEWTYPDYRTAECLSFFTRVRESYLKSNPDRYPV